MELPNENFQLIPYDVHIWHMSTPKTLPDEWEGLLSDDERKRAFRFHFPIHKNRFIAARANLRKLISRYENIPPGEINFSYNEFGKPFLQDTFLQFNVSHSHDLILYGFTLHHRVGVDIEKIDKAYDANLAKRFFSAEEFAQLELLPENFRKENFYKIWAKKEAIIKATGLGMKLALDSFSVSLEKAIEEIPLQHEKWQLHYLQIDDAYQAALATEQEVKKIIIRKL